MSLSGFDSLRARHPDQCLAVEQLEREITQTLSRDPTAVIDDEILTQQLSVELQLVQTLLVELVASHALRTLVLWRCPNGLGTTREAEDPKDFPELVECQGCGQVHRFKREDVEVRFLPSEDLLREMSVRQT